MTLSAEGTDKNQLKWTRLRKGGRGGRKRVTLQKSRDQMMIERNRDMEERRNLVGAERDRLRSREEKKNQNRAEKNRVRDPGEEKDEVREESD